MINMLNALVEKEAQWQRLKDVLMGSPINLTQLKDQSVNRPIDRVYPNWNSKGKKKRVRGGGSEETRTGHLRTGNNIKW